MKWFDAHKDAAVGSDSVAPANSYAAIAEISDVTLVAEDMVRFVRQEFSSQKAFGEFLGVGESTVAGWMKSGAFPDYAKRATLAAYYSTKYFHQLAAATRETARVLIVKDGGTYSIVRFAIDEAGVAIGSIIARGVPTKDEALILASGDRAWELLREAGRVIDNELDAGEQENTAWIKDLKNEIGMERARTFHHDKLIELERKRREALDQCVSVEISHADHAVGGSDV